MSKLISAHRRPASQAYPTATLPALESVTPLQSCSSNPRRGILRITFPVDRDSGLVTRWDEAEQMLHHAFYNELRVAPEEHAVLCLEPTMNTQAQRERLTQTPPSESSLATSPARRPACRGGSEQGQGRGLDGRRLAAPPRSRSPRCRALRRANPCPPRPQRRRRRRACCARRKPGTRGLSAGPRWPRDGPGMARDNTS